MELPTVRPFFAERPDILQEILGRYPDYGRRSALMPLLWEVQRAERHVSEARLEEIAEIVGITATEAKGVMSFYGTYHEYPVGRFHLQVCRTLPCALAGADELYAHLAQETGLVAGETASDGRFSLQSVECLGSCGTAPVLQINDTFHERVGRARCDHLLAEMRADREPAPTRERQGDHASAEAAARVLPSGPLASGAPASGPQASGAMDGPPVPDSPGGAA